MSRLSQMLVHEQKRLGQTDREICKRYGWMQQSFSKWKHGTVPRIQAHESLASFLHISRDMLDELIDEAKISTGNTKLPPLAALDRASEYGKVTDRKAGKFRFDPVNDGRKAIPEGRYSVQVDTKVMEPGLHVGTKIWLDPGIFPDVGHEVIVHAKSGNAWIGRLESFSNKNAVISQYAFEGNISIKDVEAIHVIVLSERI